MLLSFAQFEREVTGERIRDKIAASKKKGIWVGGVVPLGYKVVDRKLMIDEAEAPIVRLIFERYLRPRLDDRALMRELRERGVVTRTAHAVLRQDDRRDRRSPRGRSPISSRTGCISARSTTAKRAIPASMPP